MKGNCDFLIFVFWLFQKLWIFYGNKSTTKFYSTRNQLVTPRVYMAKKPVLLCALLISRNSVLDFLEVLVEEIAENRI